MVVDLESRKFASVAKILSQPADCLEPLSPGLMLLGVKSTYLAVDLKGNI
jgi:hypothetical protein